MTNATVTGVQSRTLTLKYKDGEAEIVVGPDVPIITLVVGRCGLVEAWRRGGDCGGEEGRGPGGHEPDGGKGRRQAAVSQNFQRRDET